MQRLGLLDPLQLVNNEVRPRVPSMAGEQPHVCMRSHTSRSILAPAIPLTTLHGHKITHNLHTRTHMPTHEYAAFRALPLENEVIKTRFRPEPLITKRLTGYYSPTGGRKVP